MAINRRRGPRTRRPERNRPEPEAVVSFERDTPVASSMIRSTASIIDRMSPSHPLGAVVIGSNANLRAEMRTDIRAVESRLSAVEQRQARTEGLLEGLRDAITARNRKSPPPRNEPT